MKAVCRGGPLTGEQEMDVPDSIKSMIIPGSPLYEPAHWLDAPIFTRYVFKRTDLFDGGGRVVFEYSHADPPSPTRDDDPASR